MARKFRTKEWAIMMFVANDNNLGPFTEGKIDEINSVGSTTAADVILQFDSPGRSRIRRFRLSKGVKFRLRALQQETNTGDARTLIQFLDLTLEDFHPRRAMVVVSNHGTGSTIASDEGPRGRIFRSSSRRSGRTAGVRPQSSGAEPGADALDNLELKAALMTVVRKHGRFELVVFDACLMSTIEVAYQLRHACRIMVGSQSNIPVPGCCFADAFAHMRDEKIATGDVARKVVDNLTPVVHDEYSAMAALDLDQVDEVADAITVLAEALTEAIQTPEHFHSISLAHLRALAFLDSETIDLSDFCRKLAETVDDENVQDAAVDVLAAVDQLVLHSNPQGAIVAGAGGISITLPRRNSIPDAYRELDFARETSWVEFLEAYLEKRFP